MANNELAIRFTENYYATKSEVSKELKMSLIDNIWNNILSYRSFFDRQLTIKSIDNSAFRVCVCPSISNNINQLDSKLLRLTRDYIRLNPESGDLMHFEEKCGIMSLTSIAKAYQLDVDDMYLRSLIRGELKDVSKDNAVLRNYYNALAFIKAKAASPIDIDFLAELYSKITGNEDLTSFYRTQDDKNPENRVLIDTIYSSAPAKNIEEMMDSLFGFIANSSLGAAVKACVTYYYVSYIKPFPVYSDEIAMLLAKSVLAHFDLSEFGAVIPLEELLCEDLSTIAKICIDVQKTNDATYFVNYGIKFISSVADKVLDILAQREAFQLKKDFYREETPVEEEKPVEPVAAPVVEEVKEVVEEPVYETPAPQVTQRVVVQEQAPIRQESREEIAISYIPPVLDERAACRLEEHLLELDPSMKRGEAHFYARHCTIGKRYTIQQYKKSIGCAYETARTSMDHLVAMGYYRKEMVKNKNVYTPISKK